ncbi:WhiB family transcriptional regulator [Streptomyces misionensis]
MEMGEAHGVWGGMSEGDRRRLKCRAARNRTKA